MNAARRRTTMSGVRPYVLMCGLILLAPLFPIDGAVYANAYFHEYRAHDPVEGSFGTYRPTRAGVPHGSQRLQTFRLSDFTPPPATVHALVPRTIPNTEQQLRDLLRFFDSMPDREQFAGLVQILTVVARYGEPGHAERIRALPVTVQRGPVVVVNGQRGVMKRYVHRNGASREAFWPLGPQTSTDDQSDLAAPADGVISGPAVSELLESTSQGAASAGQPNVDWCEYYDAEFGDLSSECATEAEHDEQLIVVFSAEEELAREETEFWEEVNGWCYDMERTTGIPADASELCSGFLSQNGPGATGYPAVMVASDFVEGATGFAGGGPAPLPSESEYAYALTLDCVDSSISGTEATCVMAAIAAAGGAVYAGLEVSRAYDTGFARYFGRQVARRLLFTHVGLAVGGVALAAIGIYEFASCLRE